MSKRTAEEIRDDIQELVKEYYETVHKPTAEFVPGESRVNYAGRHFGVEEMSNLVDSSLEFWLTHGRFAKEFEQKLAQKLGVKYSLLVNSGSSANLLAFMALTSPMLKERQVKRGDEVITVAAAFPTTVAPIVQYGAVPVFVDIERTTCNIDTTLLEKALSPKSKAVMIAHTLGNPIDILTVKEFCHKHNLWLIEDNCDALGSEVNGQLTGTFGDIGTSSFYPPHHLTMGEGGAVYTSNLLLKKIMTSLRDWGRDCWCESGRDNTCGSRFTQQFGSLPIGYDHKYVYSHFGYNLKATEMQASIGVVQLDRLDEFTQARRKNFDFLKEQLSTLSDVLALPQSRENATPSWFGFLMQIKENTPFSRNDIVEYLEKNHIQTRNLFSGNIIRHPLFETLTEDVDYRVVNSLVNTDSIMNNAFWIGVYPGMTKEKLQYMVETIRKFCAMV